MAYETEYAKIRVGRTGTKIHIGARRQGYTGWYSALCGADAHRGRYGGKSQTFPVDGSVNCGLCSTRYNPDLVSSTPSPRDNTPATFEVGETVIHEGQEWIVRDYFAPSTQLTITREGRRRYTYADKVEKVPA